MTEPPDQMPAAAGRGHLRASHADREQVIGTLKAAFVQGMLAKDEFDLRLGPAFASRSYEELAVASRASARPTQVAALAAFPGTRIPGWAEVRGGWAAGTPAGMSAVSAARSA